MNIADTLKIVLNASLLVKNYVQCLYNYVHENAIEVRTRDL